MSTVAIPKKMFKYINIKNMFDFYKQDEETKIQLRWEGYRL